MKSAHQLLATATVRASQHLGLSSADLSRTLGLSELSVSRLVRGDKALNPQSKEGELALLLVRVYRSLDALVGTDDGKRRAWMSTPNDALGGVPITLVQKAEGLVATLNYLNGMRKPRVTA